MEHVSSWITPKNVFVTIEGDECPVPYIDKDIAGYILHCSMSVENADRIAHMTETLQWLMSLSDAEVEAGTVYFLDRWTWDTGHPLDAFFGRLLERERARRRALTTQLDAVKPTDAGFIMEALDQLAGRIEANGK